MSLQGEAAAEVTAAAAEDVADNESKLNIADANAADSQGDAAPDSGDGEVDEPGEIAPRLDQVDTEIYELLLRSITDEDDKSEHVDAAQWFRVLPTEEELPAYYKGKGRIMNPISLFEINAKVTAGQYPGLAEFYADVMLMFKNARQFNQEGDTVHECALELQSNFKIAFKGQDRKLKRSQALQGDKVTAGGTDTGRTRKRPRVSFEEAARRVKSNMEARLASDNGSRVPAHNPPVVYGDYDDADEATLRAENVRRKVLQDHKVILTLHKTFAQGSSLANYDRQDCSIPWLNHLMGEGTEEFVEARVR